MSIVIAVVLAVVLVGSLVAFALSRRRAGSRPAVAGPRRPPAVADELARTEVRDEAVRHPEQPTLISEGEAIREQVEARLHRERPVGSPALGSVPLAGRDDLAWQIEQEQRERYPSTYGAADAPPAGLLAARDQLAWQIEQDERRRFPDAYPTSRHGLAGPIGGGLQPEMLQVSDALELQLQEIALRSRPPVAPARLAGRRRRPGLGRSRRPIAEGDPVDPQGERLAP